MSIEVTITQITAAQAKTVASAKKYDYRLIRVKKADGKETTVSMTPDFKTTALKTYQHAGVLRKKVQEACDEHAKVVENGRPASRSMYVRDWLVKDMRVLLAQAA